MRFFLRFILVASACVGDCGGASLTGSRASIEVERSPAGGPGPRRSAPRRCRRRLTRARA